MLCWFTFLVHCLFACTMRGGFHFSKHSYDKYYKMNFASCFNFHEIFLVSCVCVLYCIRTHTQKWKMDSGRQISTDKHLFPCTYTFIHTHIHTQRTPNSSVFRLHITCLWKPSFYLFTCCATGSSVQSIIKRSYEQSPDYFVGVLTFLCVWN